jgi:LysM repeat protein
MKIPNLFIKKKKLRAATRTVPRRVMEESEEPSMRLSSAFVVVLLLHLVAVGGIYAFNSIKTHQGGFANPPAAAVTPAPAVPATDAVKSDAVSAENAAANKPLPKTADHKVPDAAVKTGVQDSGQIYTVAKGDNPVTIAKRLHVSYDEMLKLNKIEDPKKLQIGQKLHIPPRIKSN